MPKNLDFNRLLELLADPDVGGDCWIENLTGKPIDPGPGMAKIQPGERLYLGSYQRLRAATKISRSPEKSAKEWREIKFPTFTRIAALLQIFARNGCPLVDPDDPFEPIVFYDTDELAAWERVAHLHNQHLDPYADLPSPLAPYFKTSRLVLAPAFGATKLLPPIQQGGLATVDSSTAVSKHTQNVEERLRGMALLIQLIQADMRRLGVDTIEAYTTALFSEVLGVEAEVIAQSESVVRAQVVAALYAILINGRKPEEQDPVFLFLSRSLVKPSGEPFVDAVELQRYCGLLNGNGHPVKS